MAKKRAKGSPRDQAFADFADALGRYLASIGWSAVVVGRPRIQQQPLARAFNYEFVVDFTGGEKRGKDVRGED